MNILLISQCQKNALKTTRRILDQFAERCGERTWQTPITQIGLNTLHRLLKQSARKNTAVACYWTHGKNHTELLWIVGNRRQFNAQGRVPTHRTKRNILRRHSEHTWQYATSIQIVAALAALLHDLGKATQSFQHKLLTNQKTADAYRHEWLSLRLFQAMLHNCSDDPTWLHRLTNWSDYLQQRPQWHTTIIQGNQPSDCDFSQLPPLAKWVAWLIVSHHRLPLYPCDYSDSAQRYLCQQNGHPYLTQNAQQFFELLQPTQWVANPTVPSTPLQWQLTADPTTSPVWQKNIQRWASKALHHQPLMQLCQTDLIISNPLLLHLSRLCLMVGDHNYSSQRARTAQQQQQAAKKYQHTLIANTDDQGQAKQFLDEHLCGVAQTTAHFAHLLPHLNQELPALIQHKPFHKTTTNPRFQWQNRACYLAQSLQTASEQRGFFGINLASTGCGKTLGNARIMYALAHPERGARFTIALGLRVLTLQTGDALRNKLKLHHNDSLATLVGNPASHELYNQHTNHGSESALALHSPNEILNIGETTNHHLPSDLFRTIIHDPTARQLLHTPIVSCTIDHLMQISEQHRGGRYIAPMLRLLTSDLILDEPDDFSTEDLPALSRLVYWAGLLGSRVLLSSATLTPDIIIGLHTAYQQGRNIWNAQQGLSHQPVITAWFDEFNQYSACPTIEQFAQTHHTFCQQRSQLLLAQPIRRQAKILNINLPNFAPTLLQGASQLHQAHAQTCPHTGKHISIGLIRFANINPMLQQAHHLFQQTAPHDTTLHITCYHANQLLLLRSQLENTLDRLLNRHQPKTLFDQPEIKAALAQSSTTHHIFIIMGTAVTEVGRDHDYDWAIIEPSSTRSIIQLAGRIWRHRPNKIACHPNILILSHNIKALNQRNIAYCRPGFENPQHRLSHHDTNHIIPPHEQHNITALPRLLPPSIPNPPNQLQRQRQRHPNTPLPYTIATSLTQLEHQVMHTLFCQSNNFLALYRAQHNAAPFTAHHALISPFRHNLAEIQYTALWQDSQQTICFKETENAWQHPDDDTHQILNILIHPLPTNPAIFPWLHTPLTQALHLAHQNHPHLTQQQIALRYATVSLPIRQDGVSKQFKVKA